jgi:hypothetical protein
VTYFMTRTVLVIFFLLFLLFNPKPPRPLAPLVMLAIAVALYALNRSLERPFRWWSTLILALTGLVFMWVEVPPLLQPLLSTLFTGGWLMAHGMYTLVYYLRANPYKLAPESARA